MNKLTIPVLKRLPAYYNVVCESLKLGKTSISSSNLAHIIPVDDSQVRKDFSDIDCPGKPRIGYDLIDLKLQLEKALGINVKHQAFLIGSNSLAIALARYDGFSKYGLEIQAIFDNNPDNIGRNIDGQIVKDIRELSKYLDETKKQIAILTVEPESVKNVVKFLVKKKIKAIWNFTSVNISLPVGITVVNEDLGSNYLFFSQLMS